MKHIDNAAAHRITLAASGGNCTSAMNPNVTQSPITMNTIPTGKEFTLFVGVEAELGPQWAKVILDAHFVTLLNDVRQAVDRHQLSRADTWHVLEWQETGLLLDVPNLSVTAKDFCWETMVLRHAAQEVRTKPITFAELIAAMQAADDDNILFMHLDDEQRASCLDELEPFEQVACLA